MREPSNRQLFPAKSHLRHLRHSPSLDTICRLIAGAAGENSFGAHTSATILLAALRPAAARDARFARLVALLACSVGDLPDPGVPPATARWCTRVLREEVAAVDRLVLAIQAEDP